MFRPSSIVSSIVSVTATALLAWPVPALADPAAVERCRASDDLEERIACLEAALAEAETVVPDSPADGEQAEEMPPSPPAVEPEPVAPSPADATVPDADTATGSADASGIGAEQLERQSAVAELARATGLAVARYDQVPFRRLVVYLENGQVWRQIKGDTQTIRATLAKNRTVDIEESSLGGYRLRLNEMRRTIRVERVR